MLALERKFNIVAAKNPYWSSYVQFWSTLQQNCYSEKTVRLNFFRLVNKNDYDKKEQRSVLAYLLNTKKVREDSMKLTEKDDLGPVGNNT
jgi:hypothetical protein